MFICKYCGKECKNKNSLTQHQIRCIENPDKIITIRQKWTEEQKSAWSKKCLETNCNRGEWSDERREQNKIRKIEHNSVYWTEQIKQNHSKIMKEVVKLNPDSYSKNNVSGRVKTYQTISSTGITKVKGKWELSVAEWLNENNIGWTNDIKPYNYFWNDNWHMYFPDFFLIDFDILIEVKGYETDRDSYKWESVNDKRLIIIKEKEIKNLNNFLKNLILCYN